MNKTKGFFAIILSIIMVLSSFCYAFAADDEEDKPAGTPNLQVINGQIFDIDAGEETEVDLTIRNLSSAVAYSILVTTKVEDVAGNPLTISMDGPQSIGNLGGNATKTIKLKVKADKTAETKTYGITVGFTYKNSDSVFSQSASTIYFRIQNPASEPVFSLDNFKCSKDVIAAGDSGMLSFQLINRGPLNMNSVIVSAEGDGTVTSIRGLNTKNFAQIHAGTREDVTFEIVASPSAANGNYPVNIKVQYKDDNGKSFEKEFKYYISIGTGSSTKADVQIKNIKEPTGTYGVNQNFNVSFDLTNIGTGDAENITVTANEFGEGGNVVPKSSSVLSVNKLAAGETKNMVFTFAATDNASSRNYTVEFTVTYTKNGTETTFKQYAGVNVNNPKKDEEDEKTSKPKIIVNKYNCDPVIVMAGEEFDLTMEFLNTHSEKNVRNVKMFLTLAEETSSESTKTGNIFTPVDSSNTFYFDSIPSKGTVQKKMRLYTVPSAQPKTYTLTVNFEYEDELGNEYTSTELLGINVKQSAKIETSDIMFPETNDISMPLSAYFDIYNTGKVTLSNMKVTIEGDVSTQSSSMYLGNCEQGDSVSYDGSFTLMNIGENNFKITITGEEPSGDILTYEKEFTVTGTEPMPMDDEMMGGMPPEEEGPNKVLIGAIIGVVVVIGVVVIILVKKNKRKKAELLLDDDDDDENDIDVDIDDITEGKK